MGDSSSSTRRSFLRAGAVAVGGVGVMAVPAHAAAGGAHVVKASDFGAVGDGQADDTAAIQGAIDEAYRLASEGNGYARVEFDARTYRLASQPVRPVAGEAHTAGQLMIPLRTSGPMITLELAGAGVQTGLQFVYDGEQAPAGTMLKSTVTPTWAGHAQGQPPAVLASPRGAEWGGFNRVSVAVTNLAIQVPPNPAISGLNLFWAPRRPACRACGSAPRTRCPPSPNRRTRPRPESSCPAAATTRSSTCATCTCAVSTPA